MPGLLADAPENPLKGSPNRHRERLSTVDREAHHAPGEMVDGESDPPAEWPDLWAGEGNPGNPEAEGGGHGRQVHVPDMIRVAGGDGARGYPEGQG